MKDVNAFKDNNLKRCENTIDKNIVEMRIKDILPPVRNNATSLYESYSMPRLKNPECRQPMTVQEKE